MGPQRGRLWIDGTKAEPVRQAEARLRGYLGANMKKAGKSEDLPAKNGKTPGNESKSIFRGL